MTNREKAIVMAHTGICMLEGENLGVFYQYLNELYGRPVYTHEWITLDIKEKSKPDFLQLCKEEEPSAERRGKKKVYYHGKNTFSYVCDQCAMPIDGKDAFCKWCGARMEDKDHEEE